MTEANWTQLIAMFGVVAIPGMISCFMGWIAFKKSQANSNDLKDLRLAVDGRFTELLSSTAGRAHIEGFLAGGKDEVARAAAQGPMISRKEVEATAAAVKLIVTAAETAKEVLATAANLQAQMPTHAPEQRP